MSEEDLAFVATYYPMMLKDMCLMLSLEDQLKKENKKVSHSTVIVEPRKPKNLFWILATAALNIGKPANAIPIKDSNRAKTLGT